MTFSWCGTLPATPSYVNSFEGWNELVQKEAERVTLLSNSTHPLESNVHLGF